MKKFPLSTVEFCAVREDGLTLTLIFLSLDSPGLQTKNLGRGNLSFIMYLASSTGAYKSVLKFSY